MNEQAKEGYVLGSYIAHHPTHVGVIMVRDLVEPYAGWPVLPFLHDDD